MYDELYARAQRAGFEHGKAAGSWVIDGNTSSETAQRILSGIEDGDPEILDQLPSAPLSGEWAGDPTPESVLDDLGITWEHPAADDAILAYEEGFYDAVEVEVVRSIRAILGSEDN